MRHATTTTVCEPDPAPPTVHQMRFVFELVRVGAVTTTSATSLLRGIAADLDSEDCVLRRREYAAFLVLNLLIWVSALGVEQT